jgi:hypothetical protein
MINNIGKIGIPGDFFKPERTDKDNQKDKQVAKAPSAPLRGESSASIVSPSISDILKQHLSVPVSAQDVHAPLISGGRDSESKLIFKGEGVVDALIALEEGNVVYKSVAKVSVNPPVFRG